MMLTNNEIELIKNTTVLQLAQILEDGLLNSGWLNEEMSVFEFLKDCLIHMNDQILGDIK